MLGATGYLGSEFLILLARDFPGYPVVALVRDPTFEKRTRLNEIHPNVTVVEGTLNDADIIIEQVLKADIVINSASSDHWPSVKAILDGLEKSSASRPGKPPLYIHISGCGIISDNARGELNENIKVWSDIDLDLKEGRFRAGVQKTTLWLRIFLDYAKKIGYAGTWGPGRNIQNTIHVRDMADIVLFVFKAALEGKAAEGADGLYFACTDTTIAWGVWASKMGDQRTCQGARLQTDASRSGRALGSLYARSTNSNDAPLTPL
ncbi:hypothetical protein EIP86_010189 [Pleurotus ostreatoroseus]|nr:hypothetical protein EIP86_010189 [Pleurotus ostreatoroseus]